jgi:hypothetical protein
MCEGDDYWTDPKKLQKQVEFLEAHEKYVMVYHPWKKKKERSRNLKCKYLGSSHQKTNELQHTPHTSTRLFRSEAKYIDSNYMTVICGDLYMQNKLINVGNLHEIKCLNPSVYRKHEGGVWTGSNTSHNKLDKIKTYYLTYNSSSNSAAKQEIFINMIDKAEEFIFHEHDTSIRHKFVVSRMIASTYYRSSWKKRWHIIKRLVVKLATKARMLSGKIKSCI